MVTTHATISSLDGTCCFTLFLLISLSCLQQCGSKTPPEYKELFQLPEQQREARFKQFSIEKQVDIYTYAMYVEPPLTEFARYVANNERKAIPFLLARLKEEKSDTSKAHLIYVFKEMHEYHYSLKDERETVVSLERVIGDMKDEYRKKQCEEYLKTIKETSGFSR